MLEAVPYSILLCVWLLAIDFSFDPDDFGSVVDWEAQSNTNFPNPNYRKDSKE